VAGGDDIAHTWSDRLGHVVAIKVDGRFRKNLDAPPGIPQWESLLEFGVGLEFSAPCVPRQRRIPAFRF